MSQNPGRRYRTRGLFDGTGKWVMTESNLRYSSLPQAIREQIEKSVYSTWKKDDIDKIERAGMEAVYIIELEKEDWIPTCIMSVTAI